MTKYMLRKFKKEAKDPNTPESRLVELMNADLSLAWAVAEFGNISNKLIDELIKSSDNYLRDSLSRNPKLTLTHLQTLCTDDWLPARYTALRRLLNDQNMSEQVPLEWFFNFITTYPDPLMVKQVKFYLIDKARLPHEMLQTFAQDSDEGVRQMAQERLGL